MKDNTKELILYVIEVVNEPDFARWTGFVVFSCLTAVGVHFNNLFFTTFGGLMLSGIALSFLTRP